MKKIYSLLFATAVAALAMVSCQKNVQEKNVIEKEAVESPIHFYAEEIATKTVFGDLSAGKYPTLWTSNKGIMISQNKATSVEATVTPTSGGTKAEFTPKSEITSDGSGNYVFYALSPSTSHVSKISTDKNSWNVEIPSNQTPLAGSVDESAQVLFARYDAGTTFPTSVSFDFQHVTAYGKLSFANLSLDGDEAVTGVTLTAESNWVGRWYYYVEDYDAEPDGNPENEAGTVAPSTASKTLSLVTTSATDIWFACAPVDLRSKTLTAIVATNKGTFTKEITFPADKGNFQAGHVASFSINMSGVVRVSPVVYTEVTDVASLTLGSEIIITNSAATYAAGQRGSGKYLGQQAVTLSESKISDPSASVEVFTIGNGNIAGTYSLLCGSDSKYLSWSTSTTLSSSDDLVDASSWAIYISGGVTSIRNMGDDTRYLFYHEGNSRFTTYLTTTGGVSDVKIYKRTGTGSGAINPKEEANLSVSGATTAYTVGDSFTFDGTVDLVYTDKSTEALTSSDYTVDDSEVNMAVAGDYDVTVIYDANPLITAEYTITVSSGAPDFTTVAELNALLTNSSKTYNGTLTGAIVSFVPATNTAIIKDATGSIMYYKKSHGLKQGQTFTGNIQVTAQLYNSLYSEITAMNATFTGSETAVEPEVVTLASLVGHYSDYQNAYVKVSGLTVTAVSGKNITVSDGTRSYVIYQSFANATCSVGAIVTTATGTVTKYSSTEEIKIWKAADITIN